MLKHLNHITKCPSCGAPICRAIVDVDRRGSEWSLRVHTNGQQFEHIEATCGWGVEHSPNFSKIVERSECSNKPEYVAKVRKQAELRTRLVAYVRRVAKSEGMNPEAAVTVFLHSSTYLAEICDNRLWKKS